MAEHRELLAAPLEVESPHNLYPIARTRLGEEEAIAVYDRHVVMLSDAPTAYLFNATSDDFLILRTESLKERTAVLFNCMGEKTGEQTLPAEKLIELAVPVCGYAVIQ